MDGRLDGYVDERGQRVDESVSCSTFVASDGAEVSDLHEVELVTTARFVVMNGHGHGGGRKPDQRSKSVDGVVESCTSRAERNGVYGYTYG